MEDTTFYSIDGSEFRRADIEKPVQLPVGKHKINISHNGKSLCDEEFDIAENKRKIDELLHPDRLAAKRVLELNGALDVIADGKRNNLVKMLPNEFFHIQYVHLWSPSDVRDDDIKYLRGLSQLMASESGSTTHSLSLIENSQEGSGIKHKKFAWRLESMLFASSTMRESA